jgi:hypothetical protein
MKPRTSHQTHQHKNGNSINKMSREEAFSVSCEEVRTALLECFRVRALPEDSNFAVTFLGHLCMCQNCSDYLGQLMESFKAQQAQEEVPPQ